MHGLKVQNNLWKKTFSSSKETPLYAGCVFIFQIKPGRYICMACNIAGNLWYDCSQFPYMLSIACCFPNHPFL
ncbi:hypothetical protein Fmac_005504 [Flemingia macrophylla]|uniref:Uncharacterized protein n=1 Tax=Flemingia macrophylla TaxID=520843 RepID=A0ABD1N836_9FABA